MSDVENPGFPTEPAVTGAESRDLASSLEHRFQFHPAVAQNTQDAHQTVRDVCLDAARKIVDVTGTSSREQSLAVTHLEEAMFWANAAIARGDGPRT